MPQIFRPSSNSLSRITILAAVSSILFLGVVSYLVLRSSYVQGTDIVVEQPIAFSHKHHVKGVGLDCRFCHSSVENAASAGMPSTETCMTCHSQLFADSPALAKVRESWSSGKPLEWNRVHDMPDFVYFNHSMHVTKGVACVTCHGQVDEMPLMRKDQPMSMAWCMDCHFHPENGIGPREDVFSKMPRHDASLIEAHKVDKPRMQNCYACHR